MNEMQMTAGAAPENAAGTSEKSLFKRAFAYEIKRNLLPLAIFTAIAVVLSIFSCLLTRLEYQSSIDGTYTLYNACLSVFAVILCALCFVVPVLQFSYRMKMNSVDLWYSLPISHKQLTFVRILGGMVLIAVPYTLSYWLGVTVIALRGAHFDYIWYLPNYFVCLALGAMLSGVNAFIFTRANRVGDGIIFMIAWACILPLLMNLIFPQSLWNTWSDAVPIELSSYYGIGRYSDFLSCFFTASPVAWTSVYFGDCILKMSVYSVDMYHTSVFLGIAIGVGAAEAVAAYLALFLLADRDKAENADQMSSSWMGYKVLIPAYLVLGLRMLRSLYIETLYALFILAVVLIIAFIGYFAYRRSFRLKWYDLVTLGASFCVGTILFFV